jgi:hypothetical protein
MPDVLSIAVVILTQRGIVVRRVELRWLASLHRVFS